MQCDIYLFLIKSFIQVLINNLSEEVTFKGVKMRRQPLSVISNSSLGAKTSSGRVRKPPKRFIEEGGQKTAPVPNVNDKKVDS